MQMNLTIKPSFYIVKFTVCVFIFKIIKLIPFVTKQCPMLTGYCILVIWLSKFILIYLQELCDFSTQMLSFYPVMTRMMLPSCWHLRTKITNRLKTTSTTSITATYQIWTHSELAMTSIASASLFITMTSAASILTSLSISDHFMFC